MDEVIFEPRKQGTMTEVLSTTSIQEIIHIKESAIYHFFSKELWQGKSAHMTLCIIQMGWLFSALWGATFHPSKQNLTQLS